MLARAADAGRQRRGRIETRGARRPAAGEVAEFCKTAQECSTKAEEKEGKAAPSRRDRDGTTAGGAEGPLDPLDARLATLGRAIELVREIAD